MIKDAQDRFLSRKWGVFHHYLHGLQNGSDERRNPVGKPADWNDCVDSFDVEKLAYTLHKIKAGYYFITLMQGDQYMIAPNETFDRIAGTKPGEACARRDLPADLCDALSKYDIDLFLYYTGDGPCRAVESIGKRFDAPMWHKCKVSEKFVDNWAAVLEEYAVRYGDKVKGWWIDGCYEYLGYNDRLMDKFNRAIKKGNPDGMIACNSGVHPDYRKWYESEDFVCGEFNDFDVLPESRFIDGAQAHILAPLGVFPDGRDGGAWAYTGVKRDREYMLDFVRRANEAGCVVTIDIWSRRDGECDPEQLEVLRYLGENL
jgi:hypothetical protein